jgi:hypothetical protein
LQATEDNPKEYSLSTFSEIANSKVREKWMSSLRDDQKFMAEYNKFVEHLTQEKLKNFQALAGAK